MTSYSSVQNFETTPIAETSDLNAVATTERFELASDGAINEPIPKLKSSQQTTSDNQLILSNNYDDIMISEVSNDLSKSHGQKLSNTNSVLTNAKSTYVYNDLSHYYIMKDKYIHLHTYVRTIS